MVEIDWPLILSKLSVKVKSFTLRKVELFGILYYSSVDSGDVIGIFPI